MRSSRLCALSAVLCAGPALAAVRKEILNRDEPQLETMTIITLEIPLESTSMPESDHDTTSTTLLSSLTTSSSNSTTTTSSSIDLTTSTIAEPPPDPPASCPGELCVTTQTVPDDQTSSISCVDTGEGAPKTVISTSYTSTTTFYGNSTDYTPPFPPMTTLPFCKETETPSVTFTFPMPVPSHSASTRRPPPVPGTSTFVTTDKNPKVVFEPSPPPDYSSPHDRPSGNPGQHNTAKPDDHSGPDPSGDSFPDNPKPKPSPRPSPRPSITVTAGPNKIIIGTSTIRGLKPDQSSTVVVDDETFTILPTAVIGGGGTVEKPAPVQPSEWKPSPTMTNIGGLPVSASGSVVEIDGRTMTIPEDGTTTQINGQDIILSPGDLKVGDKELSWQVTETFNMDAIVAGGEMLTAIGPTIFVLNETTLTYGPDMTESEVTVDNDVITLAPDGIIVNNSTLGGPSAADGATTYAVVGGVTITQIGSSLLVVNGHTFTVNDDSGITTMVEGQMMTIGPDGVQIDNMTIDVGDDNMVTGTIKPGDKTGDDGPEETGSSDEGDEDEDDMAGILRPDSFLLGLLVGVGVWVYA